MYTGSSIPPNLVCDNETETFPLEVICNGTAQCSDNSDEIDLLCQGIPVYRRFSTHRSCFAIKIGIYHSSVTNRLIDMDSQSMNN